VRISSTSRYIFSAGGEATYKIYNAGRLFCGRTAIFFRTGWRRTFRRREIRRMGEGAADGEGTYSIS